MHTCVLANGIGVEWKDRAWPMGAGDRNPALVQMHKLVCDADTIIPWLLTVVL